LQLNLKELAESKGQQPAYREKKRYGFGAVSRIELWTGPRGSGWNLFIPVCQVATHFLTRDGRKTRIKLIAASSTEKSLAAA
jgi:hypothetical protein